jgi:heme exporter protein D
MRRAQGGFAALMWLAVVVNLQLSRNVVVGLVEPVDL